MGFRDMEAFSLALLAKQGWRLLNNPESLLHKMLKARYFPRSFFLDAKVGFQPSYAWRSLLKGRDVLNEGTGWFVGNGTKIKVFKDRWIPRPHKFMPILNPHGFDDPLMMSGLID